MQYQQKPKTGEMDGQQPIIKSVFITNLPADYTEQNMTDVFKESGLKCMKATLLQDNEGRSKCAGFVEFAGNKEAQDAVKHANNMSVNNKRLNVQLSKK